MLLANEEALWARGHGVHRGWAGAGLREQRPQDKITVVKRLLGQRGTYLAQAARLQAPLLVSHGSPGPQPALCLDQREDEKLARLSEKTPSLRSLAGAGLQFPSVLSSSCRRLEGTHRWVGLMELAELGGGKLVECVAPLMGAVLPSSSLEFCHMKDTGPSSSSPSPPVTFDHW